MPVSESPGFKAGLPQLLFQARFAAGPARAKLHPTADGKRFLVLAGQQADMAKPANVMLNWTRLLDP